MQGITDVILLSLLRTDFSKQKFNKVILFGITITIRYMICSLFSFLFYLYINFYVNLFLDIIMAIQLRNLKLLGLQAQAEKQRQLPYFMKLR